MKGVPFDVRTYVRAVESYLDGRKEVEEIVRRLVSPRVYHRIRRLHPRVVQVDDLDEIVDVE